MPTIIKSITLLAGEQFILPPGAVLISTTNTTLVTNSCGTLENLEDLNCYAFVFGNAGQDGGDHQLFESTPGSSVPAIGIRLNDVFYPFATSVIPSIDTGVYSSSLGNSINQTSAGQLIFEAVQVCDVSTANLGTMCFIVFKTTPTIAKTLQLAFKTYAPGFNSNNTQLQEIIFYVVARPYADVSAYNNIPACS